MTMPAERPDASDAQLKKGVLEMCVLNMIRAEPTYGYDVMKNIKLYFPEVNESTVYVILRRLHGDGGAEVTVKDGSGGPPRKYYKITEAGLRQLASHIASWRRVNEALEKMGINQDVSDI
ncbi:MAG: PadR family transcriptional regulator [Clostridiales bacterium]|jgi:PadR family transcriptional regulator PadR|nr:PadR family transcriptional regulator [Clostridiales bacterium]